ncbi:MAG: ABC transporter substrate-binding protein [Evtepia sp.]|uniref:ABC transporter substrate-binding protein n=1 Tax=Evtepia sp. TaxID=2773933 RepID=UPI002A761D9B|nr:ABC transporter substrate-binding protein [Evtepia sp.]MDY3015110.1 ABC transporter substrate-binding protein [Evtepia sp.]
MKNLKKLMCGALAMMMTVSLAACGSQGGDTASGEPKIVGISQYGNHSSLDNCREGFLQGLKEAGLEEGKDYTVHYENANFDANLANQIGQSFSAEDAAIMVGIATPSATACYAAAEDKDIPVIFTAITDPVGAKLDKGNITGTSDVLPVEGQLKLIRAIQPDAKTIGIVYTTSEPNSVYSVGVYEELAPKYGFTIEKVGVTAQSEVTQAVDSLIAKKVDCFSNLTDNNVVGVLGSILEKTNEAGIPVYGSEITQMEKGCVAGAGLDYVKLGVQTGKMAAKILKGEATCQDMPYEIIEKYELYSNSKALAALNLQVPADLAEEVQDVGA